LLTFFSLIGYSIVYTVYLKHATPQNIVIGGARRRRAAGCSGGPRSAANVSSDALLLFSDYFRLDPAALLGARLCIGKKEYSKAGIPMLPVTHGGEYTRLHILLYTIALAAATVMPFATRMSGWLYLLGAIALNAGFLYYAWRLYRRYSPELAHKTFRYSIQYLTLLFALLLIDHYGAYIAKRCNRLGLICRAPLPHAPGFWRSRCQRCLPAPRAISGLPTSVRLSGVETSS